MLEVRRDPLEGLAHGGRLLAGKLHLHDGEHALVHLEGEVPVLPLLLGHDAERDDPVAGVELELVDLEALLGQGERARDRRALGPDDHEDLGDHDEDREEEVPLPDRDGHDDHADDDRDPVPRDRLRAVLVLGRLPGDREGRHGPGLYHPERRRGRVYWSHVQPRQALCARDAALVPGRRHRHDRHQGGRAHEGRPAAARDQLRQRGDEGPPHPRERRDPDEHTQALRGPGDRAPQVAPREHAPDRDRGRRVALHVQRVHDGRGLPRDVPFGARERGEVPGRATTSRSRSPRCSSTG